METQEPKTTLEAALLDEVVLTQIEKYLSDIKSLGSHPATPVRVAQALRAAEKIEACVTVLGLYLDRTGGHDWQRREAEQMSLLADERVVTTVLKPAEHRYVQGVPYVNETHPGAMRDCERPECISLRTGRRHDA